MRAVFSVTQFYGLSRYVHWFFAVEALPALSCLLPFRCSIYVVIVGGRARAIAERISVKFDLIGLLQYLLTTLGAVYLYSRFRSH